jgi:hypothetical protein
VIVTVRSKGYMLAGGDGAVGGSGGGAAARDGAS